ncbi:TAXI family TRAP transporter solute-binding subunit [Piscinibacter sakaiensis]|uniref:TRAP transporter solute receptor, TAXI family n=1 Tax=Piscinibacter sakaiensis TaxID=1547922 RepID=A0A0K8P5B4_PISS1|nr:TAXI family TRAP transporter solute-binding subunit [Piscinibacter sakaiensis]GAP37694.1 TRAP transporter solute receptor, TAXI family [Piscinibacter sakaiensis]
MPQVLRHTLLSARDLLVTAGPFLLLALLLLGLAYLVLDPSPPRRVVLATGADQGAYAEFGRRYQAQLKEDGIEVVLRPTQGAAENLALLRDPGSGVDLAFLQGGADDAEAARGDEPLDPALRSLGSLFYEPVWLFYRQDAALRLLGGQPLTRLNQLGGWRLNIGAPGSGVPNLMLRLLQANGVDPQALTLLRQPQTPAVMSLLAGGADALVFASAPESLMVQMLLKTPGIALFDVAQAEAYARRFPFMSPVVLPRGVVDLAADQPPTDVRLVAPTATLVARESVHPALVQLFVQAAHRIHGEAGWFQRKGDFPNPRNSERMLAPEAERYYRSGPPFLQRTLPFWVANLVDRMWVVLVSIIAILIPLSRIVPPLYQFRVRSRVFRWYGQLQALENAIGRRPREALVQELDEIEARVARVHVPLSYADELYSLRGHIDLVRAKLAAAPGPSAAA